MQHFSINGVNACAFFIHHCFDGVILTSSSVGVLVSMLRSFVADGGWRVHLTRGGSVLHRSA